jgi:hypothetical protein
VIDGDCGSLVVSQETLEIYGHVVASNPLGEAYVVPLRNTFLQIRDALGAKELSLPSPGPLTGNLVAHCCMTGSINVADGDKLIMASMMAERQFEVETLPKSAPRGSNSTAAEVAEHEDIVSAANTNRYSFRKFLSRSERKFSGLLRGKGANIDAQTDHKKPLHAGVEKTTITLPRISAEKFIELQDDDPKGDPAITSGASLTTQNMARCSQFRSSGQDFLIEIDDSEKDSSSRAMTKQQGKTPIRETLSTSRPGLRPLEGEYDDLWAKKLGLNFEELLRTKRQNEFGRPRCPTRPLPARECSSSSNSRVRASEAPSLNTPQLSDSQPSTSNRSSSDIPPSCTSLLNMPRVPSPPVDPQSERFRNLLITISVTPIKYENSGLLDEALQVVPLDRIYGEALEESGILQAQAESMGDGRKPEWGYQDCVIRALLRYATPELHLKR